MIAVMQVVDSTNVAVSSPPITVAAELSIKYPTSPQQGKEMVPVLLTCTQAHDDLGVTSTIQWSGGLVRMKIAVTSCASEPS